MDKDREVYCRLMLLFKNEGVQRKTYFGRRWLVMKLLLAAVALAILLGPYKEFRPFALVLLGYWIGVVSAGVKSYLITKKRWQIGQQFVDWEKLDNYLNERDQFVDEREMEDIQSDAGLNRSLKRGLKDMEEK